MMKVTLAMAISANGIIATESGSEDFLSQENWLQFVKLANKVGCFIWGRKTYDAVIKWEGDYLSDLKKVKKFVISKSNMKLIDGFELANSPKDALIKIESMGFKEAIITGGATINSAFAKANLIDEIVLDVNPAILGSGIPVFQPVNFELKLELVNYEKVGENIVEIRYKVIK